MIDVYETTQRELALHKKALIWINTKSIKDESVTISQLASSLRVTQDKAKSIVGLLIRQETDHHALRQKYKIFVQKNKIPDWLREHLSDTAISEILTAARHSCVSLLEKSIHREALAERYGSEFQHYLATQYRLAESDVFEVLKLLAIDNPGMIGDYPNFRPLTWPKWYSGRLALSKTHLLDKGTRVTINFGNMRQSVEVMITDRLPNIKDNKGNLCDTSMALVGHMIQRGYGFVKIAPIWWSDEIGSSPTLYFAKNNDLGLTIRVSLPWTGVKLMIE